MLRSDLAQGRKFLALASKSIPSMPVKKGARLGLLAAGAGSGTGLALCFSDQAASQEPPRAECQRDASFLRSNSFSAAVQLGILFARWFAGDHYR